jgi:hypothetical protein
MKNININLTEFVTDPNNYMYMNEINMLKNKLWLMKTKRTEIAHPYSINLEQLKRACNKMKICDLFH